MTAASQCVAWARQIKTMSIQIRLYTDYGKLNTWRRGKVWKTANLMRVVAKQAIRLQVHNRLRSTVSYLCSNNMQRTQASNEGKLLDWQILATAFENSALLHRKRVVALFGTAWKTTPRDAFFGGKKSQNYLFTPFRLVTPRGWFIGANYLYQRVCKWMQANLVILSSLMPENVICLQKLKKPTFPMHQMSICMNLIK